MRAIGQRSSRFFLLFASVTWAFLGCGNSRLQPNEIAGRVLPSLVLIVTKGLNGQDLAQGSGFFIGQRLVATNLHIFKDADQAFVKTIQDGVNYQIAHVVGFDRINDLCVLRLKDGEGPDLLILDSSAELEAGHDVYVAGNPKGLEGSLSKGIVSAIREQPRLIQIDAAISPGSSGGPVVNERGKVVGIATGCYLEGQNLNFAVPIERLKKLPLDWSLSIRQTGLLALTDWDWYELKGPVQEVVQTDILPEWIAREAERRTGRPMGGWRSVSRFNEHGDMIEHKVEISGRHVRCEYSTSGVLIRRIEANDLTGKKSDDSFNERDGVQKMYLLKGKRDEAIKRGYDSDKNGWFINRFDADGRVTEERMFKHLTTRSYGPDGRESEERAYFAGQLEKITQSAYQDDDYGNWIKHVTTSCPSDDPEGRCDPGVIRVREITYFKR